MSSQQFGSKICMIGEVRVAFERSMGLLNNRYIDK
jgi:hypothetical protein